MHHRVAIGLGMLGLQLGVGLGESRLPPPAWEMERTGETIPLVGAGRGAWRPTAGPVLYEIGDPTDEEQLYLELINRSRADPAAEGVRLAELADPAVLESYGFFSVDLARMRRDLAAYPPAQPLAFEPRLTTAARGHSAWMKTTGLQSHDEINPQTGQVLNTTSQRVDATGYPWRGLGESVFAFAYSEEHGHAGFVVDWGDGPGGVQVPPGHRNSNFRPQYREVGIGVLNGLGPNSTGPQFVTIDFAARQNPSPLVTGVVFYDLNGNEFYDRGEGVGGVTVTVSEAEAYAVSAGSGGYAVPSDNGARTVVFSGIGLEPVSMPVVVKGGTNVKADLMLSYPPPVVSGPGSPSLNQPNDYTFTTVPGAVGYRWRASIPRPTPIFDAESGLARMILEAPGTPLPLVRRGAGRAYHLTHASDLDQILTLDALVRPKAGGEVHFAQRLGYAGDGQVASFQMKEDEGEWKILWSQRGNGDFGSPVFATESLPLGDYAGKLLRFRFVFSLGAGSYYDASGIDYGLQVDDIRFSEAEEIVPGVAQDLALTTRFAFTPDRSEAYELSVQPARSQGYWPWGPALKVRAQVGPPPAPVITGMAWEPSGRLRVDFTTTGELSGAPSLLRASTLGAAFTPVGATLTTNAPGSYRFLYQPTGETGFLRVAGP